MFQKTDFEKLDGTPAVDDFMNFDRYFPVLIRQLENYQDIMQIEEFGNEDPRQFYEKLNEKLMPEIHQELEKKIP